MTEEQKNQLDLKSKEVKKSEELKEIKELKELRFDNKTFLRPERLEEESFEKYKIRQKIQKIFLKERLKGKMFWVSSGKIYDKKQDKWFVIGPYTYNKEQYKKALEAYNEHIKQK